MKLHFGRLIDHVHLRARDLERKYHPGYYAAFLIDPDGNNVEAVYHGEPKTRSAAAVEIEI